MPKFDLRKPEFDYIDCKLFTKHDERTQKFREIGDLSHTYHSKLDNACFASDSKNLGKRTASDKILKDKTNEIAINLQYDGHQRGLASMIFKIFEKETGWGVSVNEKMAKNYTNQWLNFFLYL